jgi:large subunit ribosomal protein L21
MYAIIETGGRQFWVSPGETIRVEKLEAEQGKELTFKALWAVGDNNQSSKSADVVAEVVKQGRGPKIIVFKRRQKKAYKKQRGHRQSLTDLKIKSISLN